MTKSLEIRKVRKRASLRKEDFSLRNLSTVLKLKM